MNEVKGAVVGVDVGGTFTDVFSFDRTTGRALIAKVPTTPSNEAEGFAQGLRAGTDDLSAIGTVVHGTTVGTNALLERKGCPTGIITTVGFRDVLEMRRRDRPQTWGLWGNFEPIVPRDRRLEVDERTLADGTVRTPVDLSEVRKAAQVLLDGGAEALCIAFINAHANDANERAALRAAQEVWPNDFVVASSQILPEIREFERTSTAALNAYLQPLLSRYFAELEGRLASDGVDAPIFIVQSNGGVMTSETARRLPVRTALSGPAAGVIAAAHIAGAAGHHNVITCDMGGTSFDVSLVIEGERALSAGTAIDFGLVIRTPMIEITTIGAGGGSIAWVDRGGLLQIGPESAGSDPGPACYGLGSDRPTVTDANLLLGRINAARPIGGKLERLDVDAAEAAVVNHVGRPLELNAQTAADAIVRVANARMAGAIRLVSIERGHDPREFVAVPFGGGGALHAGALIKEVGLAKALVPRFPGVTSALGCAIADIRHDIVRTLNWTVAELDVDALNRHMVALAKEAAVVAGAAVSGSVGHVFELDMSYQGQTHTVAVPLAARSGCERTEITADDVRVAFEARYRAVYGRLLDGVPIRLLNLRVSAIVESTKFDLAALGPGTDASVDVAPEGARPMWWQGAWQDAAVYDRVKLPAGCLIRGPAVLEQADATTFIDQDLVGRVDRFGNILIERARS